MINNIANVGFVLSNELIKRGHNVNLLAKKSNLYSYPNWVSIYNNKLDELLLKKISLTEFDIVHLHYLTNWASLGLAVKKPKVPIILHCHGSDTRPKNFFIKLVQRVVSSLSNILLYSTPDLLENLRWFKGKKIYLPNPVEIPRKVSNKEKYENRILLFIPLNKVKKIEKIFPIIKDLNYEFDIIDMGPDKEYYKKIAPKNVNFINPVPHEKIGILLIKYPLILGQQSGIISVSELEAMSYGTPTLFPFRYNNFYPEHLPTFSVTRESIKNCFGNKKLGLKQRKWVKKYHDVKVVTNKLIKIYQSIIENHKF